MIRFRCHRCKRPIAAPDGYVGKKVKCPGCMIVTIVPDIPGAQAAKALKRPESRPAPAVEQGPPDPLDALAAAVDEVETASFDEEFSEYAGGASDPFAGSGDSDLVPRRRSRGKSTSGAGANYVLWFIVLALAVAVVVGVIVAINQRGGS